MIRMPIVLTALTFVPLGALHGVAAPITFKVDFNATWSAQSHPGAYPRGAHFSALIGGVHSSAVSFWAPGALASAGIEQMAEIGGTSALRNEVQSAINAGAALAVIQGSGVNSPGGTSVMVDMTPEFPFVTLVAMVAPTPDWFIGVHGFDLRPGGVWTQQATVDLYAYDAGTEEGSGFSLSNPATSPPQTIALLAAPLSTAAPRLGTFTFTRVTPIPEPATAALATPIALAAIRLRRRAATERPRPSTAKVLP